MDWAYFVWDPEKAERNKRKHGVDFTEAATDFRDPFLLILPGSAQSQEAERWIALGNSSTDLSNS